MNLIQKIKQWFFLLTINRMIKGYDAKVIVHRQDISYDILQINMGKEFTHTKISRINYNKYMLNKIYNEISYKYSKQLGDK